MARLRIDAHQHYWEPRRGDYDWMPRDNPVLYRRYGPADLEPSLARNAIDGTVVVQAAESIEETEYMLGIADASDSVLGVVGWVDFEKSDDRRQLERLARHPKLAGVRPLIQDIPDVDWMLRDDVQWAYQAIIDVDLTFDALGFPPHLDNFLTIFQRYPNLRVVIDHCMKPEIRDHRENPAVFEVWAEKMSRFADETGAYCKLSGLVTEANEDWTVEDLRPFSEHVLSAFGPERVMWGSDWPVCQLRATYDAWREAADALTRHLDEAARDAVFGGTAARFYRIDTGGPEGDFRGWEPASPRCRLVRGRKPFRPGAGQVRYPSAPRP